MNTKKRKKVEDEESNFLLSGKKKQIRMQFFQKNDDVKTPQTVFDTLDRYFHFDHDPCPFEHHRTFECPNGLDRNKKWGKSNYVNPPYSQIKIWLKRVTEEQKKGNTSVCLVTARTNSQYWQKYVFPSANYIGFLERGIVFVGFPRAIPIPLAIVVYMGSKGLGLLSDRGSDDDIQTLPDQIETGGYRKGLQEFQAINWVSIIPYTEETRDREEIDKEEEAELCSTHNQ
jgi:hypothetical protein